MKYSNIIKKALELTKSKIGTYATYQHPSILRDLVVRSLNKFISKSY